MKKILFKILLAVAGKFLAKRFGFRRYGGHNSPGYGYDPYYGGGHNAPYRGGFFKPYKYKKKNKFKKLKDLFD